MIEAIQGRDYTLKKIYKAMALKLYGKPLKNCNNHEQNEIRIQVAAKIKNNKKKQQEERVHKANMSRVLNSFLFQDSDDLYLQNRYEPQTKESEAFKKFCETRRKKHTHYVMTTPNSVSVVKKQEEEN